MLSDNEILINRFFDALEILNAEDRTEVYQNLAIEVLSNQEWGSFSRLVLHRQTHGSTH